MIPWEMDVVWEMQGLRKVFGGSGFQRKKTSIFQTYLMVRSAPHRAAGGTQALGETVGSLHPVSDTPSDDHLPPCLSAWCHCGLFKGLDSDQLIHLWQEHKQFPTYKPLLALLSWENRYKKIYLQKLSYNQPTKSFELIIYMNCGRNKGSCSTKNIILLAI